MESGLRISDAEITVDIPAGDLARLDRMAARRRVTRDEPIGQAIDALLAQEAWSGGFIQPPRPLIPPGPGAGSRQ